MGKIDYRALVRQSANTRRGQSLTWSDVRHPAHGGDRVAAALAAHGVRFVFTLCGGHISPILVAAKARGIRIVDMRDEATAVFAADAIARLTGTPGVAAVTAGPGLTNTITALKNAQLAQSPVLLLGGAAPTALQGRGALQDIDQKPLVAPHVKLVKQVRRVRDLGAGGRGGAASSRARACPGRSSSSARSTCSTTRSSSAAGTPTRPGKGTSIADRLLRWYLNRHAERMFAGSDAPTRRSRASGGRRAGAATAPSRAAAAALARAERPLIVIGSQAVVDGGRGAARRRGRRRASASRSTSRAWRAGCSGATARCRCATRGAKRCANPTACCSPACRATSGSTTAGTCAAARR